jgi:asparagine synthase (glutamine-hydrolysing)
MLAASSDNVPSSGRAARVQHDWLVRHGQTPISAGAVPELLGSAERCSVSTRTVIDGWIDNAPALAAELGLAAANHAQLYDAALEKWGPKAEGRIIGHYAGITRCNDGTLRLARSPIDAPPLFYAQAQGGGWIAASLPSAFFALGHKQTIDWDELADLLALDVTRAPERTAFTGIVRVAPGSVVTLGPEGSTVDAWYARRPLPVVPARSDAEHVAEVARMLEEACKAALAHSRTPALALSGGLDSPIIADHLLHQLPAVEKLHAVTFVPLPDSAPADVPEAFSEEWSVVERFAAMHPRLAVHQADPAHGGFDYRFREIAAISGGFNPALASFGAHHGLWERARTLGCDVLLSAAWGNQCFSADGRWSYAEDFRSLRWRRMWRNLAGRSATGDTRPMWRRVAALAILPNLPQPLRRALKQWVRPSRGDVLTWNSVLSEETRSAYRERAAQRGSSPAWEGFAYAASRAEAARRDLADNDHSMAEATLALELRYGLRYRDVAAYRPLVEYCMALPTEMFIRDGVHRFLARELAKGRMPEEQRLEARTGRHGSDWHARMAPRRHELLATVEIISAHPQLSRFLDTAKMQRMLDDFPASDSADEFDNLPYRQGLAQGLLAAQFVGLVEGRNDL